VLDWDVFYEHKGMLDGFVRPKNWSRSEVGQKSQNVESFQNGLAYSGKILADFRRVFLGYLEAPNSFL
jgi:hypothetical protein